jgi:hypothetical protein
MRPQCLRAAETAAATEASDVTSSWRASRLGVCGREERAEGFRAVATTREGVDVRRYVAREWPMPEEHPVMNQTADWGRLYGAIVGVPDVGDEEEGDVGYTEASEKSSDERVS